MNAATPRLPALSHHEILALVEPFTRRGLQLDLPASERAQRRLRFKPVEPVGACGEGPALREVLQLEDFQRGIFRVTRFVSVTGVGSDHPQASLQADGASIESLLARIEAVPPAQQFRFAGPGRVPIALHQQLLAGHTAPVLSHAVAMVPGLTVTLTLPQARGLGADIDLVPIDAPPIELPEDLLAVIGWDWARLIRRPGRWVSKLRLPRREPERSRRAAARLEQTVDHLVRTLAEPPGRFHARFRRARLGVVLRRSIPVLTACTLVAAAVVAPRFITAQAIVTQLLILSAPPLLLAGGFCLQELARFEIPPWPKALTAGAWWP